MISKLFLMSPAVLFLLLGGCGSSSHVTTTAHETIPVNQMSEAREIMEKVLLSDQQEECDGSYASLALDLIKILDARSEEITAYTNAHPAMSTRYSVIPFGDSFVRKLIKPNQWSTVWKLEEYSISWPGILKEYQRIKNSPMGADWVFLDQDVKGIVSNDEERVLYHRNYSLLHDSYDGLAKIETILQACLKDKDCVDVDFSSMGAQADQFKAMPTYARSMLKVKSALNAELKREAIADFAKQVGYDTFAFTFSKNKTVTASLELINGKYLRTYHLPLDGSNFTPGQREDLKKYIESVWKSPEAEVLVNWQTDALDPSIFKILWSPVDYGRSYVNIIPPTVHLYPYVRVSSIAHEIGHVLGMRDHYHTLWDATKCTYRDEVLDDDLMSNPDSAHVTDGEWKSLLMYYPVTHVSN
jgi:hypothetical protein